jgi:hypothetical protein
MKVVNIHWYSARMDDRTHVRDSTELEIFFRRIDMLFNITEELAALMPMKGTTTGADMYENVNC